MLNWSKLATLASNGVIPSSGLAIVFWMAFGFMWWTIPLSFLIGMASSLVTTKPKSMMLQEDKKEMLTLSNKITVLPGNENEMK